MKVNFLIAEEVRTELKNKITVLGLYAGDVIIIVKGKIPEGVPKDTPGGLERLAIVAIITGTPDGEFKFKGRLLQPSGELYQPEVELGKASMKKGYSHTVIVELKPFIVKKAGVFHFEFFVNDKMFTFPFEIREAQDISEL